MIEFNDDAEVAKNRTKGPTQPNETGGPDQLSDKLANKLDELGVGEKVREAWFKGNRDREEWLERQREFLSSWDEHVVSTSVGAFTGSSTLHLPLPLIVVRAVYSRFVQALLGSDPKIKARRADAVDREQLVLDVMKFTLNEWCNYNEGIEEEAEKYTWDGITTGSGLMKMRWECEYERFAELKETFEQGAPQLEEMADGTVSITPKYKKKWVEQITDQKVFEGPVFWRRNHEDVLVLGGEGEPSRADMVIDRDFLTADKLWKLVDRKIFRKDQVQEMIKAGPSRITGSIANEIKIERTMNAGQNSADDQNVDKRYEVLESYFGIDTDGDGINSQVVVWVSTATGKILRAAYLRNLSNKGVRPIFKWDFHKRPGASYGVGLVEMVYPLSVEMDAMHNMRIDAGLLTTLPFGFYRPNSNVDQAEMEISPGKLIPVDNPQSDIYFPNFSNRTAFGFQEEAALNTWVERITSTNDMTYGVLTGAQGATRTATGANRLTSESQTNMMAHFRRLRRSWRQIMKATLDLLQRRLPEGLEFAVTGEHGDRYFVQIRDKKTIFGDFDFEVDAPDPSGDQRATQAQQVMQLTANPLDMQLGIVTPSNRYEAQKDFYKSIGVKDFHRYVTRPQNYSLTLSPEEEVNRVLRGIDVPIVPQMDHEGFLRIAGSIMQDDHILGQFNEQQAGMLYMQMQRHQKTMQAVQAQQAQAANVGQMQTNQQVAA